MLLLASPYPTTGSVVVVNQTSQLVDATLRPVPLSEVYGELRCSARCCHKPTEAARVEGYRGYASEVDSCLQAS